MNGLALMGMVANLVIVGDCLAAVDPEPTPSRRPVLIEAFHSGDFTPACSCGFFVDREGTLIAARHGLEDASSVWLNLGRDGVIEIKDVIVDRRESDVLVLRAVSCPKSVEPYILSHVTPAMGDKCSVITSTERGRVSTGLGDFMTEEDGSEECFRIIKRTFRPGESGSPVTNDDGQVIGMCVQGAADHGKAVGAPVLSAALHDAQGQLGEPIAQWLQHEGKAASPAYATQLRLGIQACDSLRYAEAVRCFQAAHDLDCTAPLAVNCLRSCLEFSGREAEVLPMLRRAVERDPQNRSYRLLLASYYFRKGQYTDAEGQARAAHDMRPTAPSAYWLAFALEMQGKFGDARDVLVGASEHYGEFQDLWKLLAAAAQSTGDKELERQALEKYAAICPNSPERLYDLGMFESRSGSQQSLNTAYKRLRSANPSLANRLERVLRESGGMSIKLDETDTAPVTPPSSSP